MIPKRVDVASDQSHITIAVCVTKQVEIGGRKSFIVFEPQGPKGRIVVDFYTLTKGIRCNKGFEPPSEHTKKSCQVCNYGLGQRVELCEFCGGELGINSGALLFFTPLISPFKTA